MNETDIYESLAKSLCLFFIMGDKQYYQQYRDEFKKYNLLIKEEPYSPRITRILKELDSKEESYGLDHVIQEIFKRNRGSWEREYSAIYGALTELTTIGNLSGDLPETKELQENTK